VADPLTAAVVDVGDAADAARSHQLSADNTTTIRTLMRVRDFAFN
jgi:hypothetical protein